MNILEAGVEATGIQVKGMIQGFLNYSYIIEAAANITNMLWGLDGKKLSWQLIFSEMIFNPQIKHWEQQQCH